MTQLVSMIASVLCIVLPDVNVDGNGSCFITVPKLLFFLFVLKNIFALNPKP